MTALKNRTSAIVRATFCFLIGFFFLYQIISREKIYSKFDLVEIKSCLRDYSFKEKKRILKSDEYYYYVYLEKYNNTFEIPENFVRHFDRKGFEELVMKGDSIKIEVSRKSFEEINIKKFVEVFDISNKDTAFLNDKDSIEQHNSQTKNFAAVFFLIVGMIILIVNLSEDKEQK